MGALEISSPSNAGLSPVMLVALHSVLMLRNILASTFGFFDSLSFIALSNRFLPKEAYCCFQIPDQMLLFAFDPRSFVNSFDNALKGKRILV